jgi:hypothetical protein
METELWCDKEEDGLARYWRAWREERKEILWEGRDWELSTHHPAYHGKWGQERKQKRARRNALAVSLTSFLTDGVLEAYASLRTSVLRPRACWTCSRTWGTHKPALPTLPSHPSHNKININHWEYTWDEQLQWITLYEGSATH